MNFYYGGHGWILVSSGNLGGFFFPSFLLISFVIPIFSFGIIIFCFLKF